MGGDFQLDVWSIYNLSDVCGIGRESTWLDNSPTVAEGIAIDVSRLDKSMMVGDVINDTPWTGKSTLAVGDRDDTPGSDNSLSDVKGMDSSTSWLGESLSDAEDMAGETLGLGDSLSDD